MSCSPVPVSCLCRCLMSLSKGVNNEHVHSWSFTGVLLLVTCPALSNFNNRQGVQQGDLHGCGSKLFTTAQLWKGRSYHHKQAATGEGLVTESTHTISMIVQGTSFCVGTHRCLIGMLRITCGSVMMLVGSLHTSSSW